jgi:signal peptide peptidase SppA
MSQINYPHLANMLFNTPLMCTPQLRDSFQGFLLNRMAGGDNTISMSVAALSPGVTERQDDFVDRNTHHGVAIIPVHGALVTRGGGIDAQCQEINSYERLSGLFDAALTNDAVEHIVLDMNTPGGAAVGCFDFADRIYQSRGIKPITALVNYNAYSAGYMIAAAADEIVVSATSGVGSIGVIASHVDLSQAMTDAGVKVTTFYRGHHKNDLTPYEPVSDEAVAVMDKELDDLYGMFVDNVAKYRGLSRQAVIDTQAATYRGQFAIDAGLADRVSYPQTAVDGIATALVNNKSGAGSKPRSRFAVQAASMAQRAKL